MDTWSELNYYYYLFNFRATIRLFSLVFVNYVQEGVETIDRSVHGIATFDLKSVA